VPYAGRRLCSRIRFQPHITSLSTARKIRTDLTADTSTQVVDDNADVVHPLKRHCDSPTSSRSPFWPLVHLGRSQHHILNNELSCFCRRFVRTSRLNRALSSATLSRMWSVYAADDPNHPGKPNENAMPGLAPTPAPGLDPVELVVDGERFVVTRRAGSSGTYDFAWTSHPASYGFTIGSNADWHPNRAELAEQIRGFLSDIDPKTGYLRD
jgi:hypothetical protein